MDAHGTIHTHAEIEDLRSEGEKTLNAIVRENIKNKLEGLVDVPDDYLDVLETLPRARRIAWYAEAKKAAKHGRPGSGSERDLAVELRDRTRRRARRAPASTGRVHRRAEGAEEEGRVTCAHKHIATP